MATNGKNGWVLKALISFILTTVLSVIIIIEWLGYHTLVEYVLLGIFLTLVFGFVAGLIHRISRIVLRSSVKIRTDWYENLLSHFPNSTNASKAVLYLERI